MFLADTNIFLEALLDQDQSSAVRNFFQVTKLEDIYISDLSLHSIGIILYRLKKHDFFTLFLKDMIINGIGILSLESEDMVKLDKVYQKYGLDFDDAYQYMIAKKYNLQLISFDTDFDKTDRGRKAPN